MKTLMLIWPHVEAAVTDGYDAVVVALKIRSIAPELAVAESLAAVNWLLERGAEGIYFKYCSTFDSTPRGNIGPVCDAILERGGLSCCLTEEVCAPASFLSTASPLRKAICALTRSIPCGAVK